MQRVCYDVPMQVGDYALYKNEIVYISKMYIEVGEANNARLPFGISNVPAYTTMYTVLSLEGYALAKASDLKSIELNNKVLYSFKDRLNFEIETLKLKEVVADLAK